MKNHGRLTKEALMGKGWDRHVYALKYEAEKQGLPVPSRPLSIEHEPT